MMEQGKQIAESVSFDAVAEEEVEKLYLLLVEEYMHDIDERKVQVKPLCMDLERLPSEAYGREKVKGLAFVGLEL